MLGKMFPPLVAGTLGTILSGAGAGYLISGVSMGAVGIAVCGLAGRSKEKDIEKQSKTESAFLLAKGLPLCFLAGVLSALYGFSLNQGQPIADVAAKYGAPV